MRYVVRSRSERQATKSKPSAMPPTAHWRIVLPVDTNSVYIPLMKQLGYDPSDDSTDIETPTGIGNVACAAVLEFRQNDKSNQLGDLAQGTYSDWTGYAPVNTPSAVPVRTNYAKPFLAGPNVVNPNRWQP